MAYDLSKWNGVPQLTAAADNYLTMWRWPAGQQIFNQAFWGGGNNFHYVMNQEILPGDRLYFRCYDTGGAAAMFFNYINAQGLQLGIDTSSNWKYIVGDKNGNLTAPDPNKFTYTRVPARMVQPSTGWFVQPNYIRNFPAWQVATGSFMGDFRTLGNPTWFYYTVPPYSQWFGYVPTTDGKGILRPRVTDMSAGGISAGDSASMNQFLSIKMGTGDNERLSIKEMRDWVRTYSITNTPAGTVKFSDMSGSTIFGLEVKIQNESGGYPARYFNTNDAKVSVRPIGGSIPHGGKFKIILHGPGTPANDSVYLSTTTNTYHVFSNLGGTAKNSSGYRYRIYVEDIGGSETYNAGVGKYFQTDIIVGTDNSGSSIKSVGGDPNSWNNTSGAVQSINFTGQSHQAYSNTVTVLCKPDI